MDLEQLFTELANCSDLAAVYCNKKSPESFLVGQVISSNRGFALIALIDPDAKDDGWCLCSHKSFFCIDINTPYINCLKDRISCERKQRLLGDLWHEFLLYVEEHQLVVQAVGFSGKRIMLGIPIGHSEEGVSFQRVHLDGSYGRVYCLDKKKIALLLCNSNTEKEVQMKLKKGVL